VMALTSIKRSMLYKEIAAGHLIATKIGDRTIFRAADVDDWLNRGRRAA
jgi:excisionase family DNA binding protein